MATYRGLDGSLQYNSQPVAEIKQWNVQVDQELIDASKMGDGWKVNVGGQGSWRGTFQCNLDYGDTNGQKAVIDKLVTATPLGTGTAAQFRISATKYISGSIVITGVQVNNVLNDVAQVTITFVGTANPSITWS